MTTDVELDDSNQEYVMPCAEAVLMATLALMTGHAQNKNEQHLQWMAHKICLNLDILASHPALSEGFKKALQRLAQPWSQKSQGDAPAWPKASSSVHFSPAGHAVH